MQLRAIQFHIKVTGLDTSVFVSGYNPKSRLTYVSPQNPRVIRAK